MAASTSQYAKVCLILIMLCSVNDVKGFGGNYKYHTTKKSKCLNPPRTARRVEHFIGECQEEVKNKLVNEAYQILKEEVAKEHPKVSENYDYAFDLIETTQEKPEENWLTDQYDNQYQYQSQSQSQYHSQYPTPQTHTIHYQDQTASYDDDDDNKKYLPNQGQHYMDYVDLTTSMPEYENRKKRVARLLHRIRRISDVEHGDGIYHPTLVPYEDKRIAGCLLHCVYAKNNAIDHHGWPTLDGLVDFYSEGVNEHGFFMATLRSVNLCLRAVTNKYHVDRRKLPEKGESCDLAFDVFDCISDQLTGYCLDQYD